MSPREAAAGGVERGLDFLAAAFATANALTVVLDPAGRIVLWRAWGDSPAAPQPD